MQIGYHLAKIEAKVEWHLFSRHGVVHHSEAWSKAILHLLTCEWVMCPWHCNMVTELQDVPRLLKEEHAATSPVWVVVAMTSDIWLTLFDVFAH